MKEQLYSIDHTKTQNLKLIYDGDATIFEGGWWMKKEDWRKMWIDNDYFGSPTYGELRKYPRPDIGLHRDERTRQITIFFVPTTT